MDAELPRHSRPERRADAAVHAVGLGLAAIGSLALAAAAPPAAAEPRRLAALAVYAAGLLAMLGCSALYNLRQDSARRGFHRRLDHAGIFLMIAGSYTPFLAVAAGGALALGLLAFVWAVALAGAALRLLGLGGSDAALTAAYLLLGWAALVAFGPLAAALSRSGLVLLAAGGALYTIGAAFHHWRTLPYQNAIWHGFVVAGAALHYAAVLREVALPR